jgi:hypothetical protein
MSEQGTSTTYLLNRLRAEGRTDLVEAVEAGKLSVFAAGEAAGYVRRPAVLGTGSKNQARKRAHQLRALAKGGDNALGRMQELWLGPGPAGSLFCSREELQAAWAQYRGEVMRLWGSHGRRPMAWWEFDAGDLQYPGYDREKSYLYEAGVLSEAERAEVEQDLDQRVGGDPLIAKPRTKAERRRRPQTKKIAPDACRVGGEGGNTGVV